MSTEVRVGVIGTGFGKNHILALNAHPRARVTALCSTDETRAAEDARNLGVPHSFGDYTKMLREAPIDAVSITTPPAQHVEISMAALDAGKHVLCVKPLAVTLADADDLVQRARASGLVHGIDQQLRFTPPTIHAKELLDSGTIGRPLSVISSFYMNPAGYFANPDASPNKNTWFASRENTGGFFLADAPHQFDRLLWYFGPVRSVTGNKRTAMPEVALPDGSTFHCDADDSYHALIEFESGLVGVVVMTPAGSLGMSRRLDVHGDGGSLLIEGPAWDQTVKLAGPSDRDYAQVPIPARLVRQPSPGNVSPAMFELMDRFIRAILDGVPMSPSFEDGYKTQELIEGVNRSDRTGERQVLPLAPK